MPDFTKGGLVRLKSGGPKMTILSVKETALSCQWFDRNGKMHTADFDIEMVETFVKAPPAW